MSTAYIDCFKYLTDLLVANLVPESEALLGSSAALSLVSRALSDRRRASDAAADDGCRRRGDSDIVRTRCWINCLTGRVSVTTCIELKINMKSQWVPSSRI